MEIDELEEATNKLEQTISECIVGAVTPDDFKSIEERIASLKMTLTTINARSLTLNATINAANTSTLPQEGFTKLFKKLNESTTNYLINKKTLELCYQSKAIQDIVYNDAGTPEIQEKVKECLSRLFSINDEILSKIEEKKELMKKQYQLKLECHRAIYDYKDFLKEEEVRRNQRLQEINPEIAVFKEKIDRSLYKICTMKKLIVNLIAAMCHNLHDNEELIGMLAKHKELINFESIVELTHSKDQDQEMS